jgi:hypothetical protein
MYEGEIALIKWGPLYDNIFHPADGNCSICWKTFNNEA